MHIVIIAEGERSDNERHAWDSRNIVVVGFLTGDYVKRAPAERSGRDATRDEAARPVAREGYIFRRVGNLVVACRRNWRVMRERMYPGKRT